MSGYEIKLVLRLALKQLSVTAVAKKSGIAREHIYAMVSEDGNPTLSHLVRLAGAMGFQIQINPTRSPREKGEK